MSAQSGVIRLIDNRCAKVHANKLYDEMFT